jgi:hypothetical protein
MKSKQKTKQVSKRRPPTPRYKWEKGEYRRFQDIMMNFPWQFLFVCKLSEVTPYEMLNQFMNDLGQDSGKRSDNDMVRGAAIEYFIQRGYGQNFYSEQDIRKMFKELDAIGSLWPKDGDMKVVDMHADWRDKYQDYWFKKWYYRIRKKKP